MTNIPLKFWFASGTPRKIIYETTPTVVCCGCGIYFYPRETIFVEWDDSTDGVERFCDRCFRNKYVCDKHQTSKLNKTYIRPNMCVMCPEL